MAYLGLLLVKIAKVGNDAAIARRSFVETAALTVEHHHLMVVVNLLRRPVTRQ